MKSLKVTVGVTRGHVGTEVLTLFCPVCREPLSAYGCRLLHEKPTTIYAHCRNPHARLMLGEAPAQVSG